MVKQKKKQTHNMEEFFALQMKIVGLDIENLANNNDQHVGEVKRSISVPAIHNCSSHSSLRDDPNYVSIRINKEEEKCDPTKCLIPLTETCLILYAVIFVLSLGIVALIVGMAVIKVYFMKSDSASIWTDNWFFS